MVTRCLENGVFAITSNRTGTEKIGDPALRQAQGGERSRTTEGGGGIELTFTGRSQIVDPKGRVLAQANAEEEKLCIIEIDPLLAKDKKVTPNNHIFEDRRTDFYLW